jgi:hypothetical protein
MSCISLLTLCLIVFSPNLHNGLVTTMYTQMVIFDTSEQDSIAYPQTMTESIPPRQKRVAPKTNSGINGLIAACNKNDRFKLLEDYDVLSGNLDNPVHPIFDWLDTEGPMRQMLQLASHFIGHDSLLVFFVPLVYGRELTGTVGRTSKTYLSDPIANVSDERHNDYLAGVREALRCLGHSISFRFQPPAKRVYARTIRDDERPAHAASCCPAFQRKYSCRIEMADYFRDYYRDGEYASASRCAQFRQDFLFAATLVHELVHAVGVLRRGNLNEPHIRVDCPETEWGYGWEHFMFGNVINPQDRTRPGTHLLMRKVWADQKKADEAGGKEYADVPMSYIAQWFRKEIWGSIAEYGPIAVPVPTVNFKIQSSNKYGAWIVSTDRPKIKKYLKVLHRRWKRSSESPGPGRDSSPPPAGRMRSSKILWKLLTTAQLQKDNVLAPVRIPQRLRHCVTYSQQHCQPKDGCRTSTQKLVAHGLDPDAVYRSFTPINYSICSMSRKRRADSLDEWSRASKIRKQ